MKNIKPNSIYLIHSTLFDNEFYRVKIISVGNFFFTQYLFYIINLEKKENEINILYERIDFADRTQFFESNDKLYFATPEVLIF